MKKSAGLLGLLALFTIEGHVHANSLAKDYPYDVFDKAPKYSDLTSLRSKLNGASDLAPQACLPDLRVNAQIFVHDSVNGKKPWDEANIAKIKGRMAQETPKVNQAFCDDSFGAKKVQFNFSYTFITDSDFNVPSMKLGDVLNAFGDFWRSGKKRDANAEIGLIYVVNSDPGFGGLSWVGPDVGSKLDTSGPALNWAWENKGEVIAHELGHYFGASHDHEGSALACEAIGQVMGGGRTLTWSDCSRNDIQAWLRSDRSLLYYKSRLWLNDVEHVSALGGNGGGPFALGCKEGSSLLRAQFDKGVVGGVPSLTSIRIECSDGFSNLQGQENIFNINADFRLKAYFNGAWLSGVAVNDILLGASNQYLGELSCAQDKTLVGFFGRRGAAIDQVGLLCAKQSFKVGAVGGPGTNNGFDLSCGYGKPVQDFYVGTGDVVGYRSITNVGIRCADGSEQTAEPISGDLQLFAAPATNESIGVYHGQWINGLAIGASKVGETEGHELKLLRCPAGKRILGIFGSYGSAIDTLGLKCQ